MYERRCLFVEWWFKSLKHRGHLNTCWVGEWSNKIIFINYRETNTNEETGVSSWRRLMLFVIWKQNKKPSHSFCDWNIKCNSLTNKIFEANIPKTYECYISVSHQKTFISSKNIRWVRCMKRVILFNDVLKEMRKGKGPWFQWFFTNKWNEILMAVRKRMI